VGYVAVTQSDLTCLREVEARDGLALDVTSVAGTTLKDAGTSQAMGDWMVAHEACWLADTARPPLEEEPVLVLGGGNIGRAIVRALRARGCVDVVIVDTAPDVVRRALSDDGLDDVAVIPRRTGQPLPPAAYLFSAAGRSCALGAADLAALAPGTVVFNCASRNELDTDFLVAAARSEVQGVAARPLEGGLLPEHQTLALTWSNRAGTPTVLVRRRGQPAFDGVAEKNLPVLDMAFAAVLAAAAEERTHLQQGAGGPAGAIRFLSDEAQRRVMALAEDAHGLDLRAARARLAS
jgi:hypothetical protein